MTDEKKLPWNNALSILRPALLNTPERVIKYLHGFVLVPEPEALRLHALDERVKKFEEAAGILTKLEWSIVEFDDSAVDNEILNGLKLLREAMREDR